MLKPQLAQGWLRELISGFKLSSRARALGQQLGVLVDCYNCIPLCNLQSKQYAHAHAKVPPLPGIQGEQACDGQTVGVATALESLNMHEYMQA